MQMYLNKYCTLLQTVIDPSDTINVAPQAQVKSKTSTKFQRSQSHHATSLCDYELDNDSEIDFDDTESCSVMSGSSSGH